MRQLIERQLMQDNEMMTIMLLLLLIMITKTKEIWQKAESLSQVHQTFHLYSPGVPAKWHLNPSSGLSRVHKCDRRQTETERPRYREMCMNRRNRLLALKERFRLIMFDYVVRRVAETTRYNAV